MTNKTSKLTNFAGRINEAMTVAGLDLTKLSELTGISYEMVRRYSLGIAQPRISNLKKIAEKTGVSIVWLQFGDDCIPPSGSIVRTEDADRDNTHEKIAMYDFKLSAGNGNTDWVMNKNEDPLTFHSRWFKQKRLEPENLRAMYVRGDSMTPELNDWDTVIIDISNIELIDGEIYAIIFKDKFYIKRIRRTENGFLLVSSNPEYKLMEVNENNIDRFHVLGLKVWRGG